MLEQVLKDVCIKMSNSLSSEQLRELENVLYLEFQGKKLEDECYELIDLGKDSDSYKIDCFKVSKKIAGLEDDTIYHYITEANNLRLYTNKNFEDITTMDVRRFLAHAIMVRNCSAVTVHNIRAYLNSFFQFLHVEGFIQENPVARIEPIKREQTILYAFSVDDMENLRNACDRDVWRNRALLEFLYATGLRVSEVCRLCVKDVDFSLGEFKVMGKGRKERKAYISETSMHYLLKYLEVRQKIEKRTMDELQSRPLFANIKKPYDGLTIPGVQYILKQIGKKAGVENVHPHRFRRTFATDMLNHGMELEKVSKIMGHTKIETTMIYCNIKQDSIREAYKRIAS